MDLPAFFRIYSSEYLIPFPLYGSGFLNSLILAATCPTSCLLIPFMITVLLLGVSIVIPSGFSYIHDSFRISYGEP